MTNISYTRMLRGRVGMNTCRIILLTSLVWLLIDVILIMHYADFLSNGKRSDDDEV